MGFYLQSNMVKQNKSRIQFLILPTKDSTHLQGGCDHSLVERVVGNSSPFSWSVVDGGVDEGTEAVPCRRRRMYGLRGGRELEGGYPLLSTSLHDSKIHILRVGEVGGTPVIHRVGNQEIGRLI